MVNSVWIVTKYIYGELFEIQGVFTNTTKDHVKDLVIKKFGKFPFSETTNSFVLDKNTFLVLSKHDVNKFR